MAGHSKWKNIRIRKGKQDAIKGKKFTKISREIIVAARAGGGDPGMNPRLRVAVEKARAVSMPVDNIKRAIQRGTGEIEGANYEELTYEGRGPGGAAIIIECYSENKNRT
ncbi:MAG: YebC/PmpR family DNA-binding transcriptional regulator, partial [Armatimonadota bacterium]